MFSVRVQVITCRRSGAISSGGRDLLRWFNLTSNKPSFDSQNLTEKKSLFLARKNVPKAAVLSSIGSGGIEPPIPCMAASLATLGFSVSWGYAVE